MSKPTPKPRPPPKPDLSALSNKPPLRPKPRRVPPAAPVTESTPPPRPVKPIHLQSKKSPSPSKNTKPDNKTPSPDIKNILTSSKSTDGFGDKDNLVNKIGNLGVNNNEESTETEVDELYDDVVVDGNRSNENEIEEDNLYDDVSINNSKETEDVEEDNIYHDIEEISNKPDGSIDTTTNKPPPPKKPLPLLPAAKTQVEQPQTPSKDNLSVRTTPASRISPHSSPLKSAKRNGGPNGVDDKQGDANNSKENNEQKDQKPSITKPQKPPKPSWLQGDSTLNHDSSIKKGSTVDDQSTVDAENVLYSDKLIFGSLTGDDADENVKFKPIKKRMATRRQQPGSTTPTSTATADAVKRRPPPPPPPESEDTSCSVVRSSSLKGPAVPSKTGHLTVNQGMTKSKSAECIPKTAEDQSLYSYAYEHTFLPASGSSPVNRSSIINTADDNSYVEPDATVVAEVMEEIHINRISDGTYEVPEKELQSDDDDSDDSHTGPAGDYEEPCDSPPPIPSRKPRRTGSYDVTSPENDDSEDGGDVNDDDDDDDSDDDDKHDYCLPPDAKPPCRQDDFGKTPSHPDDFGVNSEEDDDFSEDEFDDNTFLDEESSIEEPLYQVYTARTLQRDKTLRRTRTNSNQADTSIDDITKGTLRNMRMLWCEMPEVVSSGILETISANERKRQEAMFEVITSEASYLKSLKILVNHFIQSSELTLGNPLCVIEKAQYHILFSNVNTVLEASQTFLDTLRKRSSSSFVVSSISDIIGEYASKHFGVYIKYCSNQIYQDRVLQELRKSPRFLEGIERLEKSAVAQSLSLQSFLVLPMQRITRLPLLVDAICHRCEPGSEEFIKTDEALKALHKVVRDCNEGARKMERMEEIAALQPQIEFTVKPIALASSNRWLLRRGEIVLVIEQLKSPISKKKLKLKPVYMFLFNDLLLITKKKGESRYRVLDYAYRNMTKVEESTDSYIQLDHMLSLILLENCNHKTKDFLLCAESETDKTRWLEAFNPLKAEREGEKVYGAWDCPQVQAIHDYTPQQPDELALHEGDVINVQRKLPDGWHYGERLCDGICGWFPANYTENILNEHVRARNLLQRYRLLAASKHLIGAVQTMKAPKSSKLTLKSISSKRDTIS